jgi:WD40 repeat protein
MIFSLVEDLAAVLEAIPADHPRRSLLGRLAEGVRRDVHFIDRHPTTLFQCLWNSCWWRDCPDAAKHLGPPEGGWGPAGPPWERPGPKAHHLLELWRGIKESRTPGFTWLRALRPPPAHDSRQVLLIAGLPEGVAHLAVPADGTRIVTAGRPVEDVWHPVHGWERHGRVGPPTVRTWDARSGAEIGPGMAVEGLAAFALSPNGARVAVATGAEACLRDATTGQVTASFRPGATALAFSSDGRRLACGADDGTVRIRDAETGADLHRLDGHTGKVAGLAFSPDGRRLASTSADGTLRVWDATRSAGWVVPPSPPMTPEEIMEEIRASGAGSYALFRPPDPQGGELICLRGGTGGATCVAWSADGGTVVGGWGDGSLCAWGAGGGAERWSGRGLSGVTCAALSRDGEIAAAGCADGSMHLWAARTAAQRGTVRAHGEAVTGLAFLPDPRLVASASGDRTVRVWDWAAPCDPPGRLTADQGGIAHLALSRGADLLAVGSAGDTTVRVLDLASWAEVRRLKTPHGDRLGKLAFSRSDDFRLMTVAFGLLALDIDLVFIWDVRTGACLHSLMRPTPPPEGAGAGGPLTLGAQPDGDESVLRLTPGGGAAAWFPAPLHAVTADEPRRLWAGARGEHVTVLALEGEVAGSAGAGAVQAIPQKGLPL